MRASFFSLYLELAGSARYTSMPTKHENLPVLQATLIKTWTWMNEFESARKNLDGDLGRISTVTPRCDRAAFSSPEAALILVSTKNRNLWPSPATEVRDSRTSRHSAHAQS